MNGIVVAKGLLPCGRASSRRRLTMLATHDMLRIASPTIERNAIKTPGRTPSLAAPRPQFTHSRAFDLLAAAPLIVWYGFALVGIVIKSGPQLAAIEFHFDWRPILDLVSQLASMVFLGLQIVLFLVRKLPVEKAAGWRPRLAGLVGSNLQLVFLALPR